MGRRPSHPDDPLPPSRARPRSKQLAIHLSPQAWRHLRSQAELYGYVKRDSQPARGIVNYFALGLGHPHQTFTDARPEWMIALSTRLLDPALDAQRHSGIEHSPTSIFSPDAGPIARSRRSAPGTRFAVWWDPDALAPREQHMFMEDQFPLDYFARLALTWGITDPRNRQFQLTPLQRASNALEAIGLQTLAPTLEVFNPIPFTRERIRTQFYREVQW